MNNQISKQIYNNNNLKTTEISFRSNSNLICQNLCKNNNNNNITLYKINNIYIIYLRTYKLKLYLHLINLKLNKLNKKSIKNYKTRGCIQ